MLVPIDPLEKRLALADYLGDVDAKPWVYGEWDCTMMIARWIERLHGSNPAAGIAYHSAEDAVALARSHGGFTAWAIRTLDAFGLPRALDPESGDVAIVEAPKLSLPTIVGVMAIRSGELWVVKTPRGLIGQKFAIIAAWRL